MCEIDTYKCGHDDYLLDRSRDDGGLYFRTRLDTLWEPSVAKPGGKPSFATFSSGEELQQQ